MRSKSFIAGALGVLLIFAGQSAAAQEDTLPVPDRETSARPAPDRGGSILSAPDRDGSTLPVPDASTLPAPVLPATPAAASPAAPAARVPDITGPVDTGGVPPIDAAPAAGQERNIPLPVPDAGSPPRRERRVPERGLFWGLSAGVGLFNYNTDGTDMEGTDVDTGIGFGGTLFFGMDFGRLIGQVEVLLMNEIIRMHYPLPYDGTTGIDITGTSLLVPFVFKADFHLGPVVLQPLAGLYLNVAIGTLEESGHNFDAEDSYANPLFGLMLGGSFGITLGRGLLFLDTRYAMDLGRTVAGSDSVTIWRRSALMFNLGYQFSLGRRR